MWYCRSKTRHNNLLWAINIIAADVLCNVEPLYHGRLFQNSLRRLIDARSYGRDMDWLLRSSKDVLYVSLWFQGPRSNHKWYCRIDWYQTTTDTMYSLDALSIRLKQTVVGLMKFRSLISLLWENLNHPKYRLDTSQISFIFYMCFHSSAAVMPPKYEHDILQASLQAPSVLIILKNTENIRTEKIAGVILIPRLPVSRAHVFINPVSIKFILPFFVIVPTTIDMLFYMSVTSNKLNENISCFMFLHVPWYIGNHMLWARGIFLYKMFGLMPLLITAHYTI